MGQDSGEKEDRGNRGEGEKVCPLHTLVLCEIFRRLVHPFSSFLLCILMHGGKRIQALKAVIK